MRETHDDGPSDHGDVELTIGEAAEYLGVSVRTLHHWDDIGLLSPVWRTTGNYRLYTSADLRRAQLIIVYREAGMALSLIGQALDSSTELKQHLERQKSLLEQRLKKTQRMIRAVDKLLKEQEHTMTPHVIKKILGTGWDSPYQEEAEQRWGHTPEWKQSQEVRSTMSDADWTAYRELTEDFARKLDAAARRGVEPGSEHANELAEAHRATIEHWYPCTHSRQIILARMYCQDPRFARMYMNHTDYLLEIVEANARRHGVEPGTAQW